jgi:hypothetical protein
MTNLRKSQPARQIRAWIRKEYRKHPKCDQEAIFRGIIYAITGKFLPHRNGNWSELELYIYEYFKIEGGVGSFTSSAAKKSITRYIRP